MTELGFMHKEQHGDNGASQANWLRASVLGASDGIVSVASLVVGVAGATTDSGAILISGVAGLLAGAFSMSAGEYVSVSSQRDVEYSLLEKEREELKNAPVAELEELTRLYESKGLTRPTAELVARELSEKDALRAHLDTELHIDPESLTNPWHAAFASWISFIVGGILPVLAITLPPEAIRVPATFASVILALGIAGALSARVSNSSVSRVTFRVVAGGVIAMTVTYVIGWLFGAAVV